MSLALFCLTMYACTDTDYQTNAIKDTKLTETRGFNGCPQSFCFPPNSLDSIVDTFVVNGCTITVQYVVEKCPTTISVRNFEYTIGNSSACNNVNQVWNQYYLNGQSQLANEALNSFYRDLTLMVQTNIINGLDPNDYDPNVPFLDFQWIETGCHTSCTEIIYTEDGPVLGGIFQVECGKGCCARVTKFIFDSNGDPDIISTEVRGSNDCDPIRVDCDFSYDPNYCQPACARL